MNIYVGNIPHESNDGDLRSLFEEYGDVDSAKVIMDRDTGRSRGFGFVEMPSQPDAQKAIGELNGKDFMGRPLNVNEARPKPERRGGGYGGGGGGHRGNRGGGGGRY